MKAQLLQPDPLEEQPHLEQSVEPWKLPEPLQEQSRQQTPVRGLRVCYNLYCAIFCDTLSQFVVPTYLTLRRQQQVKPAGQQEASVSPVACTATLTADAQLATGKRTHPVRTTCLQAITRMKTPQFAANTIMATWACCAKQVRLVDELS